MKNFVFRNYTVEYLFPNNTTFSGYGDVMIPNELESYDNIVLFYQLDPSKTPEAQIDELEEIKSKIDIISSLIKNERLVVVSLANSFNQNWQLREAELSARIHNFNEIYLKQLVNDNPNVKKIELNQFLENVLIETVDWRFLFTSQIVLNPKLAKPFKQWFESQLAFLNLKRKKCIILDCDNTLWGGVVGEDGVHGVKLGQDYPGNVFRRFQELLLMLSKKGVILAVCSKNNLADVEELWKHNKFNLINGDVLSSYRINWQNKADNIKSIAEELNIGVDSLVFIDDNPLERGMVKEFLPEVAVPEFPTKAYELVDFFWKVYNEHFSTYELSAEDLKKTEQYKENFIRNESKKSFASIDDYLASLEIEIDIQLLGEGNVGRLAQMTQKTNQFNLRTQRYTEEEVRKKQSNGSLIYCANVKDKFGDNGITIASIVDKNDSFLFLDSYLLSCRILGREIEKVTLLTIIDRVRKKYNLPMRAEFIPTKKNGMARDFLEKVGFVLEEETIDGIKKYVFNPEQVIEVKDFYKININ